MIVFCNNRIFLIYKAAGIQSYAIRQSLTHLCDTFRRSNLSCLVTSRSCQVILYPDMIILTHLCDLCIFCALAHLFIHALRWSLFSKIAFGYHAPTQVVPLYEKTCLSKFQIPTSIFTGSSRRSMFFHSSSGVTMSTTSTSGYIVSPSDEILGTMDIVASWIHRSRGQSFAYFFHRNKTATLATSLLSQSGPRIADLHRICT